MMTKVQATLVIETIRWIFRRREKREHESDGQSPDRQGQRLQCLGPRTWVSCSGGRNTACGPLDSGGAQPGEQRGPDIKHSDTKTKAKRRRKYRHERGEGRRVGRTRKDTKGLSLSSFSSSSSSSSFSPCPSFPCLHTFARYSVAQSLSLSFKFVPVPVTPFAHSFFYPCAISHLMFFFRGLPLSPMVSLSSDGSLVCPIMRVLRADHIHA